MITEFFSARGLDKKLHVVADDVQRLRNFVDVLKRTNNLSKLSELKNSNFERFAQVQKMIDIAKKHLKELLDGIEKNLHKHPGVITETRARHVRELETDVQLLELELKGA